MAGETKVFISHAHEDNALCMPVVAALSAWGVGYYFDSSAPDPHATLTTATQQELVNSNMLLRVCTPAAQRSERVAQEVAAFRMLQAQKSADRRLISIILDAGYVPEPLDAATLFIDATKKQRFQWMGELARPLGVSTASRRLSRRSAIGLGMAGAVALASATSTGVVLFTNRPQPKQTHDTSKAAGNKRWSTPVPSSSLSITPRIAMAGGLVFATTKQGLIALDAASGARRWTADKAKSTSASGGVVAAGGHTYLGDDEGNVYAVNTAAGAIDWRQGVGYGQISTPAVGDGLVYVVSNDFDTGASLVALKADTGGSAWKSSVTFDADRDASFNALTFSSGVLYVGSADHHLRAISARDGSSRWDFLARGPIIGAPAVANGAVIFGSDDSYIYALDAATGTLHWRFRAGWAVRSSPAVVNGVVYAGTDEGYLYALDAATGALYWRAAAFDVDTTDPSSSNTSHYAEQVRCLPAVGSDSVYATAGNGLFAFAIKDGARQWRYATTSDSSTSHDISSPILSGDLVYCGAPDHAVHAVNT